MWSVGESDIKVLWYVGNVMKVRSKSCGLGESDILIMGSVGESDILVTWCVGEGEI